MKKQKKSAEDFFQEIVTQKKKKFGARDKNILIQKTYHNSEENTDIDEIKIDEVQIQQKRSKNSKEMKTSKQKMIKKEEEYDDIDSEEFDFDNETPIKSKDNIDQMEEYSEIFEFDDPMILSNPDLKQIQYGKRSELVSQRKRFYKLNSQASEERNEFIIWLNTIYKKKYLSKFNEFVQTTKDQIEGKKKSLNEFCVNVVEINGMTSENFDYQSIVKPELLKISKEIKYFHSEMDLIENDNDVVSLLVELPIDNKVVENIWHECESFRKKLIIILIAETHLETENFLIRHEFPLSTVYTTVINTRKLIEEYEQMQLHDTIYCIYPLIHPCVIIYNIMLYNDFHHSYSLFLDFICKHIEYSVIYSNPSFLCPSFMNNMSEMTDVIKIQIGETYDILSVLFSQLLLSIQCMSSIHSSKYKSPYTALLDMCNIQHQLDEFNIPSNCIHIPENPLWDDELKIIMKNINESPSNETYEKLIQYISKTIGLIQSFQTNYPQKVESCCVCIEIDYISHSLFKIIRDCEEDKPKKEKQFDDYRFVLSNLDRHKSIKTQTIIDYFMANSNDKEQGKKHAQELIKQLITFGLFSVYNDKLKSNEPTLITHK